MPKDLDSSAELPPIPATLPLDGHDADHHHVPDAGASSVVTEEPAELHQNITNISSCFEGGRLANADLGRLLDITGIAHDGSFLSICDAVLKQKDGWLRIGERDHAQTTRFDAAFAEIKDLAGKLGFVAPMDASTLTEKSFDYAVVHGAFAIERCSALIQSWIDGIRFNEIAFITTTGVFVGPPSDGLTELQNMKNIYERFLDEMGAPAELRAVPVRWIDTPTPAEKDRATTLDTVEEFCKQVPLLAGQKVLAVSNQPYIEYQNKFIELVFAKNGIAGVELHSLGLGIGSESAPIILDSIAKALHLSVLLQAFKSKDMALFAAFKDRSKK